MSDYKIWPAYPRIGYDVVYYGRTIVHSIPKRAALELLDYFDEFYNELAEVQDDLNEAEDLNSAYREEIDDLEYKIERLERKIEEYEG